MVITVMSVTGLCCVVQGNKTWSDLIKDHYASEVAHSRYTMDWWRHRAAESDFGRHHFQFTRGEYRSKCWIKQAESCSGSCGRRAHQRECMNTANGLPSHQGIDWTVGLRSFGGGLWMTTPSDYSLRPHRSILDSLANIDWVVWR